jgi:excisionase family DNA binding protein
LKGEETLNETKECTNTYITVKQVAEELGVSAIFVLKEIREGRLIAYKLGVLKVKRSDLDSYIESKKVQPVSK